MPYESKWTDEHRAFIMPLWDDGNTAAFIAQKVNARFGMTASRNAIIGVVSRAGGKPRENNGVWRLAGAQKRAKTILANGGYTGGKKKLPVLALPAAPSAAPLAIGPAQDFPEVGFCRWPVRDIPDFQCCGQANHPGRPYCLFHAMLARGSQPKPISGAFRSDRIR